MKIIGLILAAFAIGLLGMAPAARADILTYEFHYTSVSDTNGAPIPTTGFVGSYTIDTSLGGFPYGISIVNPPNEFDLSPINWGGLVSYKVDGFQMPVLAAQYLTVDGPDAITFIGIAGISSFHAGVGSLSYCLDPFCGPSYLGNWQLISDVAVPEPSTRMLYLFGIALIGVFVSLPFRKKVVTLEAALRNGGSWWSDLQFNLGNDEMAHCPSGGSCESSSRGRRSDR